MVNKATPLTLSGSTRAQLATKSPAMGRVGFVADDDNSLMIGNGTTSPWEYPTKTKIATMISTALSSGGYAAASHTHTTANVTGLDTALAAKAPLSSPALIGTPTVPTATAGTNTTQVASTAFVQTAVSNASGGAALSTTAPSPLAASASVGTGTTAARADHVHALPAVATTTIDGLMDSADKAKLEGIAVSANNYVHPASHPASIITQDANNRFATDTEKAAWTAKAAGNHTHSEYAASAHGHSNATESIAGMTRYATAAEVAAGSAVDAAVRPADLQAKIASLLEGLTVGGGDNVAGMAMPSLARVRRLYHNGYLYIAFVTNFGATTFPTLIYRTTNLIDFDYVGTVSNTVIQDPDFCVVGTKVLFIAKSVDLGTYKLYSVETGVLLNQVQASSGGNVANPVRCLAFSDTLMVFAAGSTGFCTVHSIDINTGAKDTIYNSAMYVNSMTPVKMSDGLIYFISHASSTTGASNFIQQRMKLDANGLPSGLISIRSSTPPTSSSVTYGGYTLPNGFSAAVGTTTLYTANITPTVLTRRTNVTAISPAVNSIDALLLAGLPEEGYQHWSIDAVGLYGYIAVIGLNTVRIYKALLSDASAPVLHATITRTGVTGVDIAAIDGKLYLMTWNYGGTSTLQITEVTL